MKKKRTGHKKHLKKKRTGHKKHLKKTQGKRRLEEEAWVVYEESRWTSNTCQTKEGEKEIFFMLDEGATMVKLEIDAMSLRGPHSQ